MLLLSFPGLATVRPQLFSYVLFTATVLILSATADRPVMAWWLPVVVAVWVNLHGGVLAGVAVVVMWFLVERGLALVSDSPARLGAVPVFVSVAALLANPWGTAILEFLGGAWHARAGCATA